MPPLDQDPGVDDTVPIETLIRVLSTDEEAVPITREDVEQLASTILRTTNICTQQNVKGCKDLILEYIIATGLSEERIQVLCKYLVSLSKSFVPIEPWKRMQTDERDRGFDGLGKIVRGKLQQPPQQSFRRLHILYIVHDLLLWCFRHSTDSRHPMLMSSAILNAIKSRLPALVGLAAFCGSVHCAKTFDQVLRVLKIWRKQEMFDLDFLSSLHATACFADSEAKSWDILLERLLADTALFDLELKVEREPDWLLPLRHGRPGDMEAPWHELPAANGLHMRRTHGYPLRWRAFPIGGYELSNGGGKARHDLISDVKHLHKELLHCFDQHVAPDDIQDVDALGNIVWKDPERETRNHWGNSYNAVEKRRELAKHLKETCIGYEGVQLQPVPFPDARDLPEARGPGTGFDRWQQQRGTGVRGGFRNDPGEYGSDYGRSGPRRGAYNDRGGYSQRGGREGRGGRGGRPGRGAYSGNGDYRDDYGGNRR